MIPVPSAHFDVAGAARLPRRPDASIINEVIPLFFIGRNRNGFWVAREAKGRTGGVFLFKTSALRFAERNSIPIGCATMEIKHDFELDLPCRSNTIAAWLDRAVRVARRLIPDRPPPVIVRRHIFGGERP
jgi:hypothetical protein